MKTWRAALGVLVVIAFNVGILGWMIGERVLILRDGIEVTLETEPVDPRSLFRGDFVILRYPISTVSRSVIGIDVDVDDGETVYVKVDAEGTPSGFFLETPPVSDAPFMRGMSGGWGAGLRVKYGIEQYFVEEGTGRALEDLTGTDRLKVVVAVHPASGKTMIKALEIDGERRLVEPLL
ncbi:MAG: GDYXXLXY domain-containing protein [Pseudomonadota bacterium]